MKDLKREYKIENSVYFNSKYGEKVLSNMYPCKLTYEGKTFNSVEQMFHVLLYRFLSDKTMQCKTSFECKEVYKTYVLEKRKPRASLKARRIMRRGRKTDSWLNTESFTSVTK